MSVMELLLIAGAASLLYDFVKKWVPSDYKPLGGVALGYACYAGLKTYTGSGDMMSNAPWGFIVGLVAIGLHMLVMSIKGEKISKK